MAAPADERAPGRDETAAGGGVVVVGAAAGDISAKSWLASAIRYTLGHWDGLTLFLVDSRVASVPGFGRERPDASCLYTIH